MDEIIEKITGFLDEQVAELSKEEYADVLRGVRDDIATKLEIVEGELESEQEGD